jgi:hypothetical protein
MFKRAAIACVFLMSVLVSYAADQKFTGTITDTMCAKDHKAMKVTPEDKCVRECVKAGAKYALYDGKEVYVLSDQKLPEKYAAQKVTVTGTLDPKTKTIKVASIQPSK